MNFLADESVDRQIVDSLRQRGHAAAITQHIEELSRAFVVITPATVRIRRRTF